MTTIDTNALATIHPATQEEVEYYATITPSNLLVKQACILRGKGFEHAIVASWLYSKALGKKTLGPQLAAAIELALNA